MQPLLKSHPPLRFLMPTRGGHRARAAVILLAISMVLGASPLLAQPATSQPAPTSSAASTAPTANPAATEATAQTAAPAQQSDADSLFTVGGVSVDITAASAAEARDQAFATAERQAFATLVDRLTSKTGQAPTPDDQTLSEIVQDVELSDERTSSVRYIGTFVIRFRPDATRQYLSGAGLRYVDRQSPTVLLLPVLGNGGRNILWEQTTPWRAAWDKLDLRHDPVPIELPQNASEDEAIIGTADAVSGNGEALTRLATRHGTPEVAVAVLAAPTAGQKLASVTVTLWSDPDNSGLLQARPLESTFTLKAPATGPDDPAVMEAAANEVRLLLDNDWKQTAGTPATQSDHAHQAAAPAGPIVWLGVTAPFASMRDWLDIKRRLETVGDVRSFDIDGLNRTSAQLTLHFQGDMQHLVKTLAAHGLQLEQSPGQPQWQLRVLPFGATSTALPG